MAWTLGSDTSQIVVTPIKWEISFKSGESWCKRLCSRTHACRKISVAYTHHHCDDNNDKHVPKIKKKWVNGRERERNWERGKWMNDNIKVHSFIQMKYERMKMSMRKRSTVHRGGENYANSLQTKIASRKSFRLWHVFDVCYRFEKLMFVTTEKGAYAVNVSEFRRTVWLNSKTKRKYEKGVNNEQICRWKILDSFSALNGKAFKI